jgi:hypothetical protein
VPLLSLLVADFNLKRLGIVDYLLLQPEGLGLMV